MLTAKEAAKRTEDIVTNHKTKELQEVDRVIEEAITNGERKCFYNDYISEVTENELVRCGYQIKKGSQYNQGYVEIFW